MGKASSAKKVARASRAGGSRRPGQRRQLAFPAIITVIVVAGVSVVLFARSSRDVNAAPLSQANEVFDHWHAAYGFYDCDTFVYDGSETGGAFFVDLLGDPQGIHTHDDGVIHIHPFLDSAGGRNARMQIFLEDVGVEASDSKLTFPDGTVWDEDEKQCGEGDAAQDGQIVLARWNSAQDAADGERPSELITEDFGDVRFRADREYYTFAFLPEDQLEEIPVRPGIIEALNTLSDLPPEENIEAPTTTTEPATGETVTTDPVTGETVTTVPASTDEPTTTTATTAAP